MVSTLTYSAQSKIKSWDVQRPVLMALAASVLAAIGFFLFVSGRYNALYAFTFAFCLAIVAIANKRAAIALVLAYLLLLGDLRRIGEGLYGFPASDLLIAVGPFIAALLVLPTFIRLRLNDAWSKVTFGLLCIMVVEIFNPLQGGIAVGLTGLLFFIVPFLWFWIGRRYGTIKFTERLLLRVILPIACLAALLGLFQTFIGFLPWEQAWVDFVSAKLITLRINGHVRAFGFSTNGAEYAYLLAIGCVCCTGAFFAGRRVYGILLFVLFPMLLLSSVRSVLVKLILAVTIQWAFLSRRGWGAIFRVLLLSAVAVGSLNYFASHVAQVADSEAGQASTAAVVLSHEAGLFAHPEHSTLGLHTTLIVEGFRSGIVNLLGAGLGASTLGGGKFNPGGGAQLNTEVDVSDVFTSLGLPGGLLFFTLIFLVLRTSAQMVRRERTAGAAALAGVCLCGIGAWIGGPGGYSLGPLYCFLFGTLAAYSASMAGSVEASNKSGVQATLEAAYSPVVRPHS